MLLCRSVQSSVVGGPLAERQALCGFEATGVSGRLRKRRRERCSEWAHSSRGGRR